MYLSRVPAGVGGEIESPGRREAPLESPERREPASPTSLRQGYGGPPKRFARRRKGAIFAAIVLALGLALTADADVTIKQTTGGKGKGFSGTATGVTYIKGHKMRSDVVMSDKTQSMVFDVDAQKLYSFDSKKKEADVWDMAASPPRSGSPSTCPGQRHP